MKKSKVECVISGIVYPGTVMQIQVGTAVDDKGRYTWEPHKVTSDSNETKPDEGDQFSEKEKRVRLVLKTLSKALCNAKSLGRHDGLGNPIVSVVLYSHSRNQACEAIDYAIQQIGMKEAARRFLSSCLPEN